jgi:hypothetical protein
MRENRDLSVVLDDWLADGAVHAPERLVERVLADTSLAPQRRALPWILGEPSRPAGRAVRFALAATIVLAVSASVVLLLTQGFGLTGPPVGAPSPSPSASPTPAAQSIVIGATYTIPGFVPETTLAGLDGWRLTTPAGDTTPGSVTQVVVESPTGTRVTLLRPTRRVERTGAVADAQAFLDSWLWTRGELDFVKTATFLDMPPAIRVDDFLGKDMEGTVAAGSALNGEGRIVVLCGSDTPCTPESTDQLSVGGNDRYRIVVLNVSGAQVVIAASADRDAWTPADADLHELLAAISFAP